MIANVETFTPEMATEILRAQNPDKNRNLNMAHVHKLAADIKAGRWMLNGETIKFNCDELLDGQHRLAACALAGIAIQSLVVREMTREAFSTIDTGRRRMLSDVLKLTGAAPVSQTIVASALNTLWLYERGTYGTRSVNRTATHEEALQLLSREPELLHCVKPAQRLAHISLIAPGPFAAFLLLFRKKDAALADIFVERLVTGAGLIDGEPVLTLRNRLAQERSGARKLPTYYEMAFLVKAWNATRRGQKLKLIKWNHGDDFPEVF